MRPTLRSVAITLFALAAITGSATAQYVDGQWTPGLFPAGQFDGAILAFKSFDDGSGPSLFIGGEFTHAGGIESRRVVRWDGHAFWPVGSGVDDGFVTSLAVFDDGTGPALYAGGAFTHVGGVQILGIARWNGHRWSALEGGYIAGFEALAVFDDGAGEKLYGTGSFTIANGGIANHIARWDGHSWSALADGGTDDHIRLLFPWYRGGQAELYAAGDFNTAGSSGSGSRIARWNGTRWSGTGFGACFRFGTSPIESMRVFDDGTGPALYVAGSFASIPGESVCTESWGVARFDGSAWSPVSGPGWAHALAVYGGGQAAALYASSDDAHYDRSRRHVVRWSGSSWLPLPDGNPFATTTLLAVFDDGGGPNLYAAGYRSTLNPSPQTYELAIWDNVSWTVPFDGFNDTVNTLLSVGDASDGGLYAGGLFTRAPSIDAGRIARWNGTSWAALGSGIASVDPNARPHVDALARFDDGTGEAIYAGGVFDLAGGIPAANVARWNGASWGPVGNGRPGGVIAFARFDDGTGEALYAADRLGQVARWDGANWSAVGPPISGTIRALAVFDDGSGSALYVGGRMAGGIAKWTGSSWAPLSVELDGYPDVKAMAVFDDGSGAALWVGGALQRVVDSVLGIGRWNGTSWSSILRSPTDRDDIRTLAVIDDGHGPSLYVTALRNVGPSLIANSLLRWNGSTWSLLGTGFDAPARALAGFDDGSGPCIFAGGEFSSAGGSPSGSIARWKPGELHRGGVNSALGPVTDVLFVNGCAGGASGVVTVATGTPIEMRLDAAPAGPTMARYAFWAWRGAPALAASIAGHGSQIGVTVDPTPFSRPRVPQPFACRAGGLPAAACLGVGQTGTTPRRAPWRLVRGAGFSAPTVVTLQAVVEDRRAGNAVGFSVTNAVVLSVQ